MNNINYSHATNVLLLLLDFLCVLSISYNIQTHQKHLSIALINRFFCDADM